MRVTEDVLESIVNANAVKKTLRSRSLSRVRAQERLYVIESPTYTGTWIYTMGTIRRKDGVEVLPCLHLGETCRMTALAAQASS